MLNNHSFTHDPLPWPSSTSPAFPGPHISPASCCRACRLWTLPSPPSGLGAVLDGFGWALASSLRFPRLKVKLPREKVMTRLWEVTRSNLSTPAGGSGGEGRQKMAGGVGRRERKEKEGKKEWGEIF